MEITLSAAGDDSYRLSRMSDESDIFVVRNINHGNVIVWEGDADSLDQAVGFALEDGFEFPGGF